MSRRHDFNIKEAIIFDIVTFGRGRDLREKFIAHFPAVTRGKPRGTVQVHTRDGYLTVGLLVIPRTQLSELYIYTAR